MAKNKILKTGLILIIFAFVIFSLAGIGAADDPVKEARVSNASELLAYASDTEAWKIILVSDINLGDLTVSGIEFVASTKGAKTFNANGYSITIPENKSITVLTLNQLSGIAGCAKGPVKSGSETYGGKIILGGSIPFESWDNISSVTFKSEKIGFEAINKSITIPHSKKIFVKNASQLKGIAECSQGTKDDFSGTLVLGSNIGENDKGWDSINFKIPELEIEKIKFDGNSYHVTIPSDKYVKLATYDQLRNFSICTNDSGNSGNVMFGDNAYYSVKIAKTGSGWIYMDGAELTDPYIMVKKDATNPSTVTYNDGDEHSLKITNVLKNGSDTLSAFVTITVKPQTDSKFLSWKKTDGAVTEELTPGAVITINKNLLTFTAGFNAILTSSVTLFYYQKFTSSDELPAGTYTQDKGTGRFTVYQGTEMYLKPGEVPSDYAYYYNGVTTNSPVYVEKLNVQTNGFYTIEGTSKNYTKIVKPTDKVHIDLEYSPNITNTKLIFFRDGDDYIIKDGNIEKSADGKQFTFSIKDNGNYDVYVDFSDAMKIPEENFDTTYSQYKLGQLYVSNQSGGEVTARLKVNESAKEGMSEVISGSDFTLEITNTTPVLANSRVYLKYYNTNTSTYTNGSKEITEEDPYAYNTVDAFFFKVPETGGRYFRDEDTALSNGVPSEKWKGPGFYTDKDGKISIPLYANDINALNTNVNYNICLSVDGAYLEGNGSLRNPLNLPLTVLGRTITITSDKETYSRGENIRVAGTCSKEISELSFYLGGTNTELKKFEIAKADNQSLDDNYIGGGVYYYVLDGKLTQNINSGTYIIYAMPSDVGYSNINSIEGQKDLAKHSATLIVTIGESQIDIVEIDKYVYSGITSNNQSEYLKIKVKAPAAEMISLYIVGQNKMYYINGKDALAKGYVKNLNPVDTSCSYQESVEGLEEYGSRNYLFYQEPEPATNTINNEYFYINEPALITDSEDIERAYQSFFSLSPSDIFNKLGQYVPYQVDGETLEINYRWYPNYIIIKGDGTNMDGTFTICVHIQEENELTNTTVTASDGTVHHNVQPRSTFNDEGENNTAFMYGEYYVIVQHPMADQIFNTEGKTAKNSNGAGGYYSGVNIFTNDNLMFNVPALQNIEAANALINAIVLGNDSYVGRTIEIIPQKDSTQKPSSLVEESYVQGSMIEINLENTNYVSIFATLEQNEFDMNYQDDNINYRDIFKVDETYDSKNKVKKATLTINTDGTPIGSYNIIILGKKSDDGQYETIGSYKTKIVPKSDNPINNPDDEYTTDSEKDDTTTTGGDGTQNNPYKLDTIEKLTKFLNNNEGYKGEYGILTGNGEYVTSTSLVVNGKKSLYLNSKQIKYTGSGSLFTKNDGASLIQIEGGVKTESSNTTKSPIPVLGILAGIGAVAVFLRRK